MMQSGDDDPYVDSLFRIIQDASPDSCVLLEVVPDEHGEMADARIIYANAAAYQLMSREPGTLTGRLLDEAFPGAEISGRYALYAEVFRTGARHEMTFYHETTTKWLRIVVVKVGAGFCIISADVSEQKRAEEVLRRSNDELERLVSARTKELSMALDAAEAASRAKSDFLSRASHELRTPLNAVIGFSGILLKNKAGHLPADTIAHVERINRNGRHLLALVNELLDLSRIEAGQIDLHLETVSLDDLLVDVREMLHPLATEVGLTLDLEGTGADGSDPLISTDPQRLRQVLLNLVGNAIKFTQRGGVVIRLVTDSRGKPDRIEIADTGPGIAHDALETLFEPFVIGEIAAHGGQSTGLGLTISRSIGLMLGCVISAASEVGRGSVFTVHFAERRGRRITDTFRVAAAG